MALSRTVLAVLIALSVAMLPATGEVMESPSPSELTMANQADMPSCPRCNTQDDFNATACIRACAALAGAVLPAMTVTLPTLVGNDLPFSLIDDTLHGIVRAPPTHPAPA